MYFAQNSAQYLLHEQGRMWYALASNLKRSFLSEIDRGHPSSGCRDERAWVDVEGEFVPLIAVQGMVHVHLPHLQGWP